MQWLKRLLGRSVSLASPTMVNGFPAPWGDGRPSLFGYLASFPLDSNGCLPDAALTLPDEDLSQSRSSSKLRWAAGAMDGVFGHHTEGSGGVSVDKGLRMLEAAAASRSPEHVKDFYDLVNDPQVLRLVDPLLEAVRASRAIQADRLHALAQWLARESPDRAPVKVGIALLGLLRPAQDTQMLIRLGMHDEFTLYAAVALANTLPNLEGEDALWSLARQVHGWGRIHIVERLAKSNRSDIKAWLLRDGYKNSVMYEYLAYACAAGGELLNALEPDVVDVALFDGAGDLIQALLAGGPAEDISAYDDGAKVISRYLAHAAKREAPPLGAYLVVSDIAQFAGEVGRDWGRLEVIGWTAEFRRQVSEEVATILAAPHWQGRVLDALESDDRMVFWTACMAAERMGLDVWEQRFERQRDGRGDQWYDLMRTRDPARIDRVIALALKQIDLSSIATGAADEAALGAAYREHMALDFILQDLGEFPGKGWPLIEAGLSSPVVRNRNMALKALGAWARHQWPEDALALLSRVHQTEPVDDVRARMAQLLGPQGNDT